jgi:hypothetical protein
MCEKGCFNPTLVVYIMLKKKLHHPCAASCLSVFSIFLRSTFKYGMVGSKIAHYRRVRDPNE